MNWKCRAYYNVWQKPEGECDQNTRGALLPKVFWSHFRKGFRQTAIYMYDQEWLIPIMTYLFTIIFSIMYHELFWFYLQNIWLSHYRFKGKVSATKIRGSSDTHEDPPEKTFKNKLIMLISIVFVCFTRNYYDISVYNYIFNNLLRNILIYFQHVWLFLYHIHCMWKDKGSSTLTKTSSWVD